MRLLLAGLVALVSSHSVAGEWPREISDAVQKIGPVINAQETAKLLAPLQPKEPYAGVAVTRDEKYGSDDRHRLDVFRPNDVAPALPVLLFVHGGGYERGDKRAAGSPFYDNVMLWATGHKVVGVNMTYRLAPANPWPAAVEDLAAAVAWTHANIARFGGDPDRIVLMGHSAGATHVSSYLAHPGIGKSRVRTAGAILVSGTYDLKPEIDVPGQRSYFGSDTALWADRSSIAGLTRTNVPLLIAHGELDVPYYIDQAEALKARLCRISKCPTFVSVSGQSHMSEIYGLNTTDTSLSEPMRSFIVSVTTRVA